ncbi:MAG: hypothetical protein HOD64_11985 [Candidatus Cloacimonetes bacterium]|jgi:hypothetical protein|nr:hypothetical protein [Candidatus Cloacimonadota bacterium]MBT4333981.1 hypothetical protein [Candidatus Cloacimonadota bacterium]
MKIKINKLNALKFTAIGLTLSIVGQFLIGKISILAVILTTLGVIFATVGVLMSLGILDYFKKRQN